MGDTCACNAAGNEREIHNIHSHDEFRESDSEVHAHCTGWVGAGTSNGNDGWCSGKIIEGSYPRHCSPRMKDSGFY